MKQWVAGIHLLKLLLIYLKATNNLDTVFLCSQCASSSNKEWTGVENTTEGSFSLYGAVQF